MKYIIKLLCYSSLIFYISLFYKLSLACKNLSVGFIYKNPPKKAYYVFDWLVVDPDKFSFKFLKKNFYLRRKIKIIAYVSIEEIKSTKKYFNKINRSWILGKNKYWGTIIIDLRNKNYQKFLIKNIFNKLNHFDGFFLDNIDSYKLVLSKNEFPSYEKAIINFLKKLRKYYPKKLILINRGFEIFPEIKSLINAFVVEGLFYGFDLKTKKYRKFSKEETQWLFNKLKIIKKSGLPIIVIDYVPAYKKTLAKQIAEKICQKGFIPYVSNINLNILGISTFNLYPKDKSL